MKLLHAVPKYYLVHDTIVATYPRATECAYTKNYLKVRERK
jgi:hypothetical protein